jgi:hypothetical protein
LKIAYRGYFIDVTVTKQMDALWTAKVWIGPVGEPAKALRDMGELEGYANLVEAEHAGLQWGRKRLNLYAQNKLILR